METKPTRKPRKPQVRKPEWDTPAQKKERQIRRRAKLHAKAVELGYETWYKAETAIIDGAIKLVKVDESS